jgi:ABC-type proline/glycine betaine transport system permease subunit
MIVTILLCVAVLCLAIPLVPTGPRTAAFVLALVALLLVCLRWGGVSVP